MDEHFYRNFIEAPAILRLSQPGFFLRDQHTYPLSQLP